MSLKYGTEYIAIPGPSVMPDAVLRAMHRKAPDIYSPELHELTRTVMPDLCKVARTKGRVACYIGNGHLAWEASLSNVVAPGDKVLALVTGRFGSGWAAQARGIGVEAEEMAFDPATPADPNKVEARLRADSGHEIKALLVTHVDTATTLRNDVAAMRAALDDAGHPALLMVDCIASLGCDRFEMDAWGVDVMVAASQKGLMVPPGMSFVFINERAMQARARMARVSVHWDWAPRTDPSQGFYQYFNGTAPAHHLYGLRASLDMIADEGIEAIWARHDRIASALWAAVDAWGQNGPVSMYVPKPEWRSRAVTSVSLGRPNAARLRDWLTENSGVTLGVGLGMESAEDPDASGFLRVGHMGHVNMHMMMGVLGAMEAGMEALGVPHGEGALSKAAQIMAGD